MKRWSRIAPAIGLPLLALAFVAVVAMSTYFFQGVRLDLTERHLYTLSPGTLRILERIPEPIKLELFYSEKAARSQPQFRIFAQRVRELLEEAASRSQGKLTLVVVDPEPFSEAEEKATSYGLQKVPLGNSGDTLYFGLVGTNSTDGEVVMRFIQPAKEAFLEYDIAKMVATLSASGKPVLALLSDLPMGPGIDPISGRPTAGWVMDRQLAEFFEIRRLQADPTSIGDDVNLLVVVHPKSVSADTQNAIDQFVLRGGHLIVFVDPYAEADPAGNVINPIPSTMSLSSDLPILFKSWGLAYEPGRVVLDSQNALQVQPDPSRPPQRQLAILGLHSESMNQTDVITADLESLNLSSAGSFSLDPQSTLKLEALVQSSNASMLTDSERVRLAATDPSLLSSAFKTDSDSPYVLAGRLTGPLKTAFPERTEANHLQASVRPVNIVVVADTDLLSDRMWVQAQDFLGQQVLNPFANNADFVYNALDNLAGNDDLIAVRTRPTSNRSFGKIELVRRSAEARYQAQEKLLQQQLDDLNQQLSRLQPTSADGQTAALSREQRAQLLDFQQRQLAARKQLREVQHQLNADIEDIGSRLKMINILGMPTLVILVAVFIAWRRRGQRREAEH